ncbi:MAG TPA: transcription antitermination factor NusB, partial [Acidimicrobiales bacterium]|nr:transcription antitermination factor NusB [Acidimicrobiales bacterium]
MTDQATPSTAPALRARRREARERALSLLYEAEMKDLSTAQVLADLPVSPDPFAVALVRGVGEQRDRLDAAIAQRAIGWGLERMPVVDRNLLRLAVYELFCHADIPVAVIISEAVELAKQYSTEESGRFVNGALAGVAGVARPGTGD